MKALPFDKREGYIWYDGQFVAWQNANIHILNHGLQYGSCVFEGERVYDGYIFKSQEHIQRLLKSALFLDINIPYSESEIVKAKEELVQKQKINNAYMKMCAWKGCDKMTVESIGGKTHFAIAAWEMHSDYSDSAKKTGIKVCTSTWRRPDPQTFPVYIKFSGAYVMNTMAKHEAIKNGFDDAMMLDYQGYVAEGSASNIFFIKDDEIHTPIPDCFLDGITRQTIIEIAKRKGIKVFERKIRPENILEFDAAFLAGTSVEITEISQLDKKIFRSNDIIDTLKDEYYLLVRNKVSASL